jgi:hypothetical protein
MVEFALILPILLLLIFGIIEVSRLLFFYSIVATASRDASRYGAAVGIGPNGVRRYVDCAGIREAALGSGRFAGVASGNVVITYDHGPGTTAIVGCNPNPIDYKTVYLGDRLIVTVSTAYAPIVPLVNIPSYSISSRAIRTIVKEVHLGASGPGGYLGTPGGFPTPPPGTPANTDTPTNTSNATVTNTLIPTNTFTPTATQPTPAPPLYNSVTWTTSGNSCNSIVLIWGPNPLWATIPGMSPSSYQMTINGSPGGTIAPGDPGTTSWSTGVSLTNGKSVVFTVMAIFPGPIGSDLLTKSFLCDKGTLVTVGE